MMTTATTCPAADLVLGALRTLAAVDGLWVEAGDDAIAEAAGVPVIDVPEALGQLEGARSIGRIDDRDGLDGRVIYLSDHPRAAELHTLAYLTRNELNVAPPGKPEPESREDRREWPRPYRGRKVPALTPLFPPVGYSPGWRCGHATNPIPKGDPVICMACHGSGYDDDLEAEIIAQEVAEAELARQLPEKGIWSASEWLGIRPAGGAKSSGKAARKAKKRKTAKKRKAARSA